MFSRFYPLFRMLILSIFPLFPSFCCIGFAFCHFAASAALSVILPHRLCFPSFYRIGCTFRHFALPAALSVILPYRFHFYRNNHVTVRSSRKTDIRNLLHLLPLPGQVWYDKRYKDICPSKGESGYDYFKRLFIFRRYDSENTYEIHRRSAPGCKVHP